MANDGLLGGRNSRMLTVKGVSAGVIITTILAGLYFTLHWVQVHLEKNPLLVVLFPPVTIAAMAVIIPLLMYISYQDEFKNLNPWNPLHVIAMSKQCYSAMARNNMKVSEKDL